MQLDRTEIVVRARSTGELFDLSLQVLKRHWWAIALTGALFGIPLLLLDSWAVAWMLSEDTLLLAEQIESPLETMRWRHSWHLTALYVLQFPLVSLPTAIYLGHRIFYQAIPLRSLLQRLWPIAGRCLLVLGVFRLGLIGLLLEPMIDRQRLFDAKIELWFFTFAAGIALFIRTLRPFAPEILGLELCPLRAKQKSVITYRVRSRALHRYTTSENLPRFLGSVFFGTLLVAMLLSAQMFVIGASRGDWGWNAWFDYVGLPLSLWIVGLFIAVFRFLSYLDNRIRLEGWEVELRLKAEEARLEPSEPVTSEAKSKTPQVAVRLVSLIFGLCGTTIASFGATELSGAESNTPASIQTVAKSLPIGGWYDKQTGQFVPPELSPADDDPVRTAGQVVQAPPPSPTWPPTSNSWNWNWGLNGLSQVLPTFLFTLLATALAVLLILLTYYSLRDYLPENATKRELTISLAIDPARLTELPFETKPTADDPLSAARRAMELENYDDAIAYLYGYMLLALDQTRAIHLQKGKTNRMYLRELGKLTVLRDTVEAAMLVFEASFFGKHRVTRQQFIAIWQQLDTFHQWLPTSAAGKGIAQPNNPRLVGAKANPTTALLLIVACMGASGCGSWFPEIESYGAIQSPDVNRSLNGLGLHRKLWETSGAKCLTPQRLSPKLNDFDVIVLVGLTYEPPGIEARRWLEEWLSANTSRTVIYFGRDFNADIYYRQQTLDKLPPADRRRGEELLALRQVAELQARWQQIPSELFCDWFFVDMHHTPHEFREFDGLWSDTLKPLDGLAGSWPVGVTLQPPDSSDWRIKLLSKAQSTTQQSSPPFAMRGTQTGNDSGASVRSSRWNLNEFDSAEQLKEAMDNPYESQVLLAGNDGTPLVFRLSPDDSIAGQILIVTNGFPLLNGSLVTPLGEAIGRKLIAACGPAKRVALLAFDQSGLMISQVMEGDERGAGLEMLTVWPLSAITMPAALLGIIACAAWWPIVGRPQTLTARSVSDFGLHIEAIGSLLMETRDSNYAARTIEEYFRKVRCETPPAWLGDVVRKEPHEDGTIAQLHSSSEQVQSSQP